MILTAADLLSTTLDELPSEARNMVESHFLSGESVHKIQRHNHRKRREIQAVIAAALAEMRISLSSRGVSVIADVI